jgi:hypothetical protein
MEETDKCIKNVKVEICQVPKGLTPVPNLQTSASKQENV